MKKIQLKIELADTPEKQERGLMFREALNEDCGMLFKFTKPQVLKFWGLNTYIPLDIAFVSPENKIIKIDRVKPFSLKTVGSDHDCLMAIEASDGFFKSKGIKVGEKVAIRKIDDRDVVIFGENPDEEEIELKDIMK